MPKARPFLDSNIRCNAGFELQVWLSRMKPSALQYSLPTW
jgi:hypothetical protein